MTAEVLRARTFAELESLGFRPAKSLPPPDMGKTVRAAEEVAARLMALNATFAWVAFPEKSAASEGIRKYIDRNALRDWMTEEELAILDLSRSEAQMLHVESTGWRLENMWALAWVLGFEPEPDLEPSLVSNEVTRQLVTKFAPGLDRKNGGTQEQRPTRAVADIIAMEYRFYCAHNAVRSAQLGGSTVPVGFDPIINGGAVHERRHALSWCVAPRVAWGDVDLST